jgi:hypothetical protein
MLCGKCGKDTEQNYLGMSNSPSRIASRCCMCGQTNYADSWKVHNENKRIRQIAMKAKLAAQISGITA